MRRALRTELFALVSLSIAGAGCLGLGRPGVSAVVVVTVDTCRADRLGCYGKKDAATPHIDALAAESVLYERAYASAPLTIPSHSTLMTGLQPPRHGVRSNLGFALPDEAETLAEVLKANGFRTGAFVGGFPLSRQFGLAQGFDDYDDGVGARSSLDFGAGRKCSETVGLARTWLHRLSANAKFFLFVHLFEPHDPYEPPEAVLRAVNGDSYQGEIATADSCLGDLFTELRQIGRWEETVVVVAGDHGESLGLHGEPTHGYLVFEPVLRVPLILKPPAVSRAIRNRQEVGLVDVFPTILEILGIPIASDLDGRPLPQLIRKEPGDDERLLYAESMIPSEYGCQPFQVGIQDGWKLIEGDGAELFDLASDADETENLASTQPDRLDSLERALAAEKHRMASAGGVGSAGRQLADEDRARLRSLGYVSGGPLGESNAGPLCSPYSVQQLHQLQSVAVSAFIAGQWKDSEELGHKIIRLYPERSIGYQVVGYAASRLRRWDDAIANLTRFLELDPADPSADEARTHLITALFHAGRSSEACRLVDGLMKRNVQLPELYLEVARFLVAAGRSREAVKYLEIAARQQPSSAEIREQLESVQRGIQ